MSDSMKALWAAIWSRDGATTWSATGISALGSVAAAREWVGLLAMIAGLVWTVLRAIREYRAMQCPAGGQENCPLRKQLMSSRDKGTGGTFAALLLMLVAVLLTSGCGLMPKRVEYFQREVKAVPQKPDAMVESEKQGARLTADLVEAARIAAWAEQASTNVINPLDDAAPVARAVSSSMGQPASRWQGEPEVLADKIDARSARLDAKVEDYRQDVQRDVGKKIEGTGLLRIPWLINAGLWIGIPLVLFWVGRVALNIWNPAIGGLFGRVERVAVDTVKRGFSQTMSGVQAIKRDIDAMDLDDKAKEAIRGIVRGRLQDHQDADVQVAIKRLKEEPPQ
jgi:hypothetical protein